MPTRMPRQVSRCLALLGAGCLVAGLQASPTGLRDLGPQGRDLAARWIREVLRGQRAPGDVPARLPSSLRYPGPETVALSLMGRGRRPLVAAGQGDSFAAALAAALQALGRAHAGRFGELLAGRVRIRVDRLGPPRELGPLRAETLEGPGFRPGLDGLEVTGYERKAVLLPYEVTLQGLARLDRVDGAGVLQSLLEGLGGAGAPAEARLRAFATDAFMETRPGETAVAHRLMPEPPRFQPAVLDRALELGARHLVRVQRDGGRFLYGHDPIAGRRLAGDNQVRQAAVVMAAAELLPVLPPGHRLREVVRRGLGALVSGLRPTRVPGGGTLRVPPPDRKDGPSLGAVALCARALAVAPVELRDLPEVRAAMRDLGRALAFLQRPDGSWYQNLGQAIRGEPPLVKPVFFPGEALLALGELAAVDPEGPWGRLADRSAAREREDHARGAPLDHWIVQGLGRHAVLRGDEASGQVAYRMGRLMARSQVLDPERFDPSDRGGFSADGVHVTPVHSACYGEALRAARQVAWRFGYDPRPLDAALVRLGAYLVGQQVRPEGAWFLRTPGPAVGGWPLAGADYRQRIDVDGHALRALLGAWEVLHDVRPLPLLAERVESIDIGAG